jgi:hypothetical protein
MSTGSDETPQRPRTCLRNVIAVVVVLFLLGALLFPAIQSAREMANRASCIAELSQIF